jgi:hypothetical protein
MIQENKIKARKSFWYSLVLFIIAQMFEVFAAPSLDFVADMTASVSSGIMLFPFGIIFPVNKLIQYTFHGQPSGDDFLIMSSIGFSFFAAISLLFGARMFSEGKGYHRAIGYLGLFGFAGIIIMLLLPDRRKEASPANPIR